MTTGGDGMSTSTPTEKVVPRKSDEVFSNCLLNRWATQNNQGSLDLYAGPLRVEKLTGDEQLVTQKKITFQLFASCPLSKID